MPLISTLPTVGAALSVGTGPLYGDSQPFWGDLHTWDAADQLTYGKLDAQTGLPDANWSADPARLNPWDKAYIGGQLLWKVDVRVRKRHRVDQKLSPGPSGATPGLLGWTPAEIDLLIDMWTPDQWRRYQQIHGNLLDLYLAAQAQVKGKMPPRVAVDIIHPGLNAHRIYKLYLVGFSDVVEIQPGVRRGSWAFTEYLPPVPGATMSNRGSISSLDGATRFGVPSDVTPATPLRSQPPSIAGNPSIQP